MSAKEAQVTDRCHRQEKLELWCRAPDDWASWNQWLEVVRYLAGERGAALDAKTKDGITALLAAAAGRHLDVQR